MIATTEEGVPIRLTPGQSTQGMRLHLVTVTAADIADPYFADWFLSNVVTRLVAPDPLATRGNVIPITKGIHI